jgi:hypothetical protein
MSFREPPSHAAWRHFESRDGFEVVFIDSSPTGFRCEGHTLAVESGDVWSVNYTIDLTAHWQTRRAWVSGRSAQGTREVLLDTDGRGSWSIDGRAAGFLDGCLDVDLESSALTNAFPVHRLDLQIGQEAAAPAVFVRVSELRIERLEQRYLRLENDGPRLRFRYRAPAFDVECEIAFDAAGLVLDYPGIAIRAG